MKTLILSRSGRLAAAAAFLAALAGAQAGSFVTDFNSGPAGGATLYGSAAVLDSGGFNNTGFLQLTPNTGSQKGSLLITPDLDSGAPVVSFTASFKVLIGGGGRWDYADGLSFNFAPDVPFDEGLTNNAEAGVGNGLSVTFRTYPNNNADHPNLEPTISVLGAGANVAGSPKYVNTVRANTFIDMVVQLNPDNTLDVVYDGAYLFSKVPLGYTPGPNSLFWIGARTGGSFEKHFIDNLSIETRTNAMPYIKSFAPSGRQVAANGSIDITITNYGTALSAETIAFSLDGAAKTPTVTPDGLGNTVIHYAPATPFAASSRHTVSLTFSDNASPAQSQTFSWTFTVAEEIPGNFVTVFSEGFESYALGKIDKEPLFWWSGVDGPNAAPNGSGNPWFGPTGPNGDVVDAGDGYGVTPHSGNQMFRGNVVADADILWYNAAYRVHGGQPIKGNCRLDWWTYDFWTSTNRTAFKEYVSLIRYNTESVPATTDWNPAWNDWTSPYTWDHIAKLFWSAKNGQDWAQEQSVSLGGSGYDEIGGNYDPSKYQFRIEENHGATYGNDGWGNTAVSRTNAWHHNRIVLGPPHADNTVMAYFFIDDMNTPVYSNLSTLATTGFGLIEIATCYGDTEFSYYDDISFALVQPPNVTARSSGSNVILTWPGEGFTLQKADSLTGIWSNVMDGGVPAASGYSYDATSGPRQFFRLAN